MKKTFLLVIVSCVLAGSLYSQKEISVMPKVGYNAVNIEKATGTLKYENTSAGTYLEAWNQFNYGVTIEAILKTKDKLKLGGELTYNRLYYWEESYVTYYGRQYRWGDVSTVGLGFVLKYHFSDMFYVKPVLGFEYYTDGSGITLGSAVAAGIDFRLSDKFTLPVEFRTDQILGNSVSLLFGIGFGLRMEI